MNVPGKTVGITLKSDLVAKALALRISFSLTAEAAVIKAFEAAEWETIREAMRITHEYVPIAVATSRAIPQIDRDSGRSVVIGI